MAEYPSYTSVGYAAPTVIETKFKTLISNFDDQGKEKRRRKWLYPKRMVSLQYGNITSDEAAVLWQFFLDMYGTYGSFSFYNKDRETYSGEYVGTGDGTTTVFSLPSKQAADTTIYVDGTASEEDTDYTYYSSVTVTGAGVDGSDRVVFNVAPTTGDRITYDFTGILRITCRFVEDFVSFASFHKRLTTATMQLQGLLNDE